MPYLYLYNQSVGTCSQNMLSNIDQCIATRQNIAAVNKELVAFVDTKNKLHPAQEFLHSITLSNTPRAQYNTDDESDTDTDIND